MPEQLRKWVVALQQLRGWLSMKEQDSDKLQGTGDRVNYFVCSSPKRKVAFISPTQKGLHDLLMGHFPGSYLREVSLGKHDWLIYKSKERFKK